MHSMFFYKWLKEKEVSYVILLQSYAAPMFLTLMTLTAAQPS